MKTTATQMKTCIDTMIRNEWNFLFFAYLFQSFIYLFSLDVKSISSWDYTRNCYLHGVSLDVFGDINNVLCVSLWVFKWRWVVSSAMKNYLFRAKFHDRFDVIFHTLCFGQMIELQHGVYS